MDLYSIFMQHEILLFDSNRWIFQSFNNNFDRNGNLNASRFPTSLTMISFNFLSIDDNVNNKWILMLQFMHNDWQVIQFYGLFFFSHLFVCLHSEKCFIKLFHSNWMNCVTSMEIWQIFFSFSFRRSEKSHVFDA